jgi:hypothetical protein
MSASEHVSFASLADELERAVSEAAGTPEVDGRVAQRLVAAAIKLYAAAREQGAVTGVPPTDAMTTEVLVLVADLLEAHDINTFDLALWLSHAGGRL